PATLVRVRPGRRGGVPPGKSPPAGVEVIDGAGKTLLPGFIDAHAHVWRGSLSEAIVFGVTTELDMFMDVTYLKDVKAREARGNVTGAADLRSAGTLGTRPRGPRPEARLN